MSVLIVIDTSIWIELFRNGPKVEKIRPYFSESWIVPDITLAEVSAKLSQVGEVDTDTALRSMSFRGQHAGISVEIAKRAGTVHSHHRKSGLSINDATSFGLRPSISAPSF